MLHITDFNGTGGESILVDGLKLVKSFKESTLIIITSSHRFPLTSTPQTRVVKYTSSFVPFTCIIDPESKRISQVHFNNCDRLPISASTMQALHKIKPGGSVADIYRAIQSFTRTMREYQY